MYIKTEVVSGLSFLPWSKVWRYR